MNNFIRNIILHIKYGLGIRPRVIRDLIIDNCPMNNYFIKSEKEEIVTTTFYTCPSCGRQSKEMKLLKNTKYFPSDEDRKIEEFHHIAHEILRCKCGLLLTWYDMGKNTKDE
jgi:hypothetical protein